MRLGTLIHSGGPPGLKREPLRDKLECGLFVRADVVAVMDKIKATCEAAPPAEARFQSERWGFFWHDGQLSVG